MGEPALLTVSEAATVLTVSRRTVERLIKAGRIRVVHPSPGRIAITDRELQAYIAAVVRAA